MSRRALLTLLVATMVPLACGGAGQPAAVAPTAPSTSAALGDRPELAPPKSYQAPAPVIYRTAQGMAIWLVERPDLPLVSVALSVPHGAADDPPGKAGLAHITTAMLDEGAGERDAVAISTAIDDVGASLRSRVTHDGSVVSLDTLAGHLPEAFAIFADVVARPRLDETDWERVHALWLTQLQRRADDPDEVARAVARAALYGADTPYGHPAAGLTDTAKAITLADAKNFYRRAWRADQALLVAVGAIDRPALDALVAAHLDQWKAPPTASPARAAAAAPLGSRPKLVLVDRPRAPQAVVRLVAPGVAADDPAAPLLDLINAALGGSFSSRLNQNLREDHHWTYGAGSAFGAARGVGPFVASSAVYARVTAPAIVEMRAEIAKMAKQGVTEDELTKVRARDLTRLIETHETNEHQAARLTTLGILGLPPDFDARASRARQAADRLHLLALGKQHLVLDQATIVVVGPATELEPQLSTLDLGKPERWTAEGRPVTAPSPK